MGRSTTSLWEWVEKTETCWLWTGATSRGYGYKFDPVQKRRVPAHRLSYAEIVGPIPAGLQLDHLCRVRNCVNPAHLEPVTNRENALRGISPLANHARKTHCPQGHEYSPSNTYIYRQKRYCRSCRAARRLAERI